MLNNFLVFLLSFLNHILFQHGTSLFCYDYSVSTVRCLSNRQTVSVILITKYQRYVNFKKRRDLLSLHCSFEGQGVGRLDPDEQIAAMIDGFATKEMYEKERDLTKVSLTLLPLYTLSHCRPRREHTTTWGHILIIYK